MHNFHLTLVVSLYLCVSVSETVSENTLPIKQAPCLPLGRCLWQWTNQLMADNSSTSWKFTHWLSEHEVTDKTTSHVCAVRCARSHYHY